MAGRRRAILYFLAAALFLIAGAISTAREGLSIKTAVGLIFWGVKSWRTR
jgi:hypothetical protein